MIKQSGVEDDMLVRESGVKSGVTCDVTFRRDHDVTHISFHRSGMKADITGPMGGAEGTKERHRESPQRAVTKKDAAVQVLQQAGGDRMYVFWEMQGR